MRPWLRRSRPPGETRTTSGSSQRSSDPGSESMRRGPVAVGSARHPTRWSRGAAPRCASVAVASAMGSRAATVTAPAVAMGVDSRAAPVAAPRVALGADSRAAPVAAPAMSPRAASALIPAVASAMGWRATPVTPPARVVAWGPVARAAGHLEPGRRSACCLPVGWSEYCPRVAVRFAPVRRSVERPRVRRRGHRSQSAPMVVPAVASSSGLVARPPVWWVGRRLRAAPQAASWSAVAAPGVQTAQGQAALRGWTPAGHGLASPARAFSAVRRCSAAGGSGGPAPRVQRTAHAACADRVPTPQRRSRRSPRRWRLPRGTAVAQAWSWSGYL